MKRFPWLILFLLLTAFPASAQDQPPKISAPSIRLVALTILVRDYDNAAKWYSENLGFEVRDNKDLRPGKRWVAMFSKEAPESQIFLLKPGDIHAGRQEPAAKPNREGNILDSEHD